MEENDKLVETILGKESPAEVKIRAEIDKLTKKLQQLDCELGKVKTINNASLVFDPGFDVRYGARHACPRCQISQCSSIA